ncbi:hypothetical protein K8Q98_00005 [Candidatus Nomurabacteria bacterium]|nr:hypothetical protein [Candidatus Nomurabacteria bacterium]
MYSRKNYNTDIKCFAPGEFWEEFRDRRDKSGLSLVFVSSGTAGKRSDCRAKRGETPVARLTSENGRPHRVFGGTNLAEPPQTWQNVQLGSEGEIQEPPPSQESACLVEGHELGERILKSCPGEHHVVADNLHPRDLGGGQRNREHTALASAQQRSASAAHKLVQIHGTSIVLRLLKYY